MEEKDKDNKKTKVPVLGLIIIGGMVLLMVALIIVIIY